MISAIGAPTATTLLAAIIPTVVRRNGMLQKYENPSRNGVRAPGSRSSWNGVRISRSETVEKVYETASAMNGSPRDTAKSAPPAGGAPSRITDAARHRDARCVGELLQRHDRLYRSCSGRPEDDGSARVDGDDDENEPEARMPGQRRHSEDGHGNRADDIGRDAEPAPVVAVGGDPGQRRQQDERGDFDGPDVSGLRGRAGNRESQKRICDPREVRAEL